nr:glutamate-cysteine ligase family protein [Pseudomonadota bacterium]
MSGPSHVEKTPIEHRAQLVDYLASGGRPAEQWRIGTEHEKFVFRTDDLRAPEYEGERGIRALLEGMAHCGWELVREHDLPIALARGLASVTLEPAGQLELSGAQVENIHETCCEVHEHLED